MQLSAFTIACLTVSISFLHPVDSPVSRFVHQTGFQLRDVGLSSFTRAAQVSVQKQKRIGLRGPLNLPRQKRQKQRERRKMRMKRVRVWIYRCGGSEKYEIVGLPEVTLTRVNQWLLILPIPPPKGFTKLPPPGAPVGSMSLDAAEVWPRKNIARHVRE